MKPVTVLDIGMVDDGHRGPYISFLSKLFDLDRKRFSAASLFSRHPVLIPLVEDSLAIYVVTGILRSIVGKRTVGFLFRPKPALECSSLRLRTKYLVLRALRLLRNVQTVTIVPFSTEFRLNEIADNWIHDPQLWDLDEEAVVASRAESELAIDIRERAAGRQICMALGRQDKSKGFDWLVALYRTNSGLRDSTLFAFGGKVSADLRIELESFREAGGFACDRFVADEELIALYSCANLIWCAYSPDYDQASGIFGRAVQLGIPVVVRRGSLLHRMCEVESISHVSLSFEDKGEVLMDPPTREPLGVTLSRTKRMRSESQRRLNLALGYPA
ncbi:hypothetical protein [Cognatiluteimonas profundi]|uniref:hypothetical protein n=1 Tax=Cognatiluteimonas profundi TaxID=2594501 RepID=UPI00131D226E|nr:hypothetical protein [Lysobacter profundi]